MPNITIDQVDVAGQRVLIRADFNVPLDSDGKITDDRRISEALPTIQSVLTRGGRVILMSHLGRPEGTGSEPEFSLQPVADRLGELLGISVQFPDTDCLSDTTIAAVEGLEDGGVVLLENLRFHAREINNDSVFATRLAKYADIYCNDAFGTAHRDHASMVGVPRAMQGKPCVAGLLLQKEIDAFDQILASPKKPFVAILGGAKISDKLGVIDHLMDKTDTILVGGAMSYTFLKALGKEIGSSKAQVGMLEDAEQIIQHAAASSTDLILPTDHVCGKEITKHTPVRVFEDSIESGWMGLDIGPDTTALYEEQIAKAQTIVWNGPMGVFEVDPFDVGTRQIAAAIARATAAGATSIAGGGDTAAAVNSLGLEDQFTHVSTGGGASLHILEGKPFNAVELLDSA